jgi:hypothetical protein
VAAREKTLAAPRRKVARATLLAGGNPRIAKGYGDSAVRAYLAAVPGWKQAVCRKLDALTTRAVPTVSKAVKYNSPMYGMSGHTWFMSFHCFDRYIKVSFFRGTQLDPPPPVESKMPGVRYFHVHEADTIDSRQFTNWVKRASELPGEKL